MIGRTKQGTNNMPSKRKKGKKLIAGWLQEGDADEFKARAEELGISWSAATIASPKGVWEMKAAQECAATDRAPFGASPFLAGVISRPSQGRERSASVTVIE